MSRKLQEMYDQFRSRNGFLHPTWQGASIKATYPHDCVESILVTYACLICTHRANSVLVFRHTTIGISLDDVYATTKCLWLRNQTCVHICSPKAIGLFLTVGMTVFRSAHLRNCQVECAQPSLEETAQDQAKHAN